MRCRSRYLVVRYRFITALFAAAMTVGLLTSIGSGTAHAAPSAPRAASYILCSQTTSQWWASYSSTVDGFDFQITHYTYWDYYYPTIFCNKVSNKVCVWVPAGKDSPLRLWDEYYRNGNYVGTKSILFDHYLNGRTGPYCVGSGAFTAYNGDTITGVGQIQHDGYYTPHVATQFTLRV